nr:hypothetical protein CFP56_55032 [Quercus suber]
MYGYGQRRPASPPAKATRPETLQHLSSAAPSTLTPSPLDGHIHPDSNFREATDDEVALARLVQRQGDAWQPWLLYNTGPGRVGASNLDFAELGSGFTATHHQWACINFVVRATGQAHESNKCRVPVVSSPELGCPPSLSSEASFPFPLHPVITRRHPLNLPQTSEAHHRLRPSLDSHVIPGCNSNCIYRLILTCPRFDEVRALACVLLVVHLACPSFRRHESLESPRRPCHEPAIEALRASASIHRYSTVGPGGIQHRPYRPAASPRPLRPSDGPGEPLWSDCVWCQRNKQISH